MIVYNDFENKLMGIPVPLNTPKHYYKVHTFSYNVYSMHCLDVG